ncbi:MAG: nucleoside deaminase, partial [Candidatus Cardinium sp.]|nr:nucleoside deaminase [Candidatus Cardinium sp.]
MHHIEKDIYFMQFALKEAQKAAMLGEIPVGALMVADSKIIARGYNQTEMLQDPTAHAEIIALTAASNYFNSKYLTNCTLYVTLEPCIMCSGALYWAQIKRLVFGAT